MKLLKSALPPIPQLEDVSPAYAESKAKLAKVVRLAAPLREEQEAINARKRAGRPNASHPASQTEKEQRVAALLGDPRPLSDAGDDERLSEIQRQLSDIDAAHGICRSKLEAECVRASAIVCEQLRGEYSSIVREICAALRTVHAASLRHHELLSALSDQGIKTSSLSIVDHGFLNNPNGHPKDRWNSMSHYFQEAKDQGHIGASDIPEELRH